MSTFYCSMNFLIRKMFPYRIRTVYITASITSHQFLYNVTVNHFIWFFLSRIRPLLTFPAICQTNAPEATSGGLLGLVGGLQFIGSVNMIGVTLIRSWCGSCEVIMLFGGTNQPIKIHCLLTIKKKSNFTDNLK